MYQDAIRKVSFLCPSVPHFHSETTRVASGQRRNADCCAREDSLCGPAGGAGVQYVVSFDSWGDLLYGLGRERAKAMLLQQRQPHILTFGTPFGLSYGATAVHRKEAELRVDLADLLLKLGRHHPVHLPDLRLNLGAQGRNSNTGRRTIPIYL